MAKILTAVIGVVALLVVARIAAIEPASARGGGSNFMNSPGYQHRLQESRGYATNQSGSILAARPAAVPVRLHRHRRWIVPVIVAR